MDFRNMKGFRFSVRRFVSFYITNRFCLDMSNIHLLILKKSNVDNEIISDGKFSRTHTPFHQIVSHRNAMFQLLSDNLHCLALSIDVLSCNEMTTGHCHGVTIVWRSDTWRQIDYRDVCIRFLLHGHATFEVLSS